MWPTHAIQEVEGEEIHPQGSSQFTTTTHKRVGLKILCD